MDERNWVDHHCPTSEFNCDLCAAMECSCPLHGIDAFIQRVDALIQGRHAVNEVFHVFKAFILLSLQKSTATILFAFRIKSDSINLTSGSLHPLVPSY